MDYQVEIEKLHNEIANIQNHLLIKDKEIEYLQNRVYQLEAKRKARDKSTFDWAVALESMKSDFLKTEPHNREKPFTDFELVFWYSYVTTQTPYVDKLTTYAELTKRASKIRELVKYYKEIALKDSKSDEDAELYARTRAKQFLEYMILAVGQYETKGGEKKHINFYIACSDWAMNTFGHLVGTWQQLKKMDSLQ